MAHSPFYLLVGTFKHNDSVFIISTEMNEQEEDIEDEGWLLRTLRHLCLRRGNDAELLSWVLIANSLEGGPKIVSQHPEKQ